MSDAKNNLAKAIPEKGAIQRRGWVTRKNGTGKWPKNYVDWMDHVATAIAEETAAKVGNAFKVTHNQMSRVMIAFGRDYSAYKVKHPDMEDYPGLNEEQMEFRTHLPVEIFQNLSKGKSALIHFRRHDYNGRPYPDGVHWHLTVIGRMGLEHYGYYIFKKDLVSEPPVITHGSAVEAVREMTTRVLAHKAVQVVEDSEELRASFVKKVLETGIRKNLGINKNETSKEE